ncbi:aldehyde dehydrogenase (NADP(+)) [Arthrobacter sp. M4]|uniref:aldehyde dehydrogenase (NADP(+)) n=1 Tax=Arthrobacter sp. M4 TaxID=218160 RepID=UPI001CDB5828|nr:aldehyde dehydrogenase (NADP(+)) [Arthrobacter sp. M4]MCA4134516.1 aldehyde dehydrogenase (NADP(+)) [Arthrobacter sp. M4]
MNQALLGERTTAAQLSSAVDAAHAAFLEARTISPATRAKWLDAVAAALEADAGSLIDVACKETHLGSQRLTGELRRTIFQLQLLAEEIRGGEHLDATVDHADPDWGMGPRPDIRRMNVPLGVVGVFGASNFPFAFSVAGGDTASALAAGCAVVHKGHDGHPELAARTAAAVTRGLGDAGAPAGLFTLVTGREAGVALVEHPRVKAIGFTGSTAGGRALMDRAAARPEPIPFFGELGGINAVVVTPSAWAERRDTILAEYAASFTMGMGQFCTKPGLLFVPACADEELQAPLGDALATVRPHPLLTERLAAGFEGSVRSMAERSGVRELIQGSFDATPRPTVLVAEASAALSEPELLRNEMFGPASLVVRYSNDDELQAIVDLLEGQLTTAIHGTADDAVDELVEKLTERSGRVLWNAWPTGVTVSYAQHHGGPYPAASSASTSVGTAAIRRFLRPVAFQGWPQDRLPEPLRDANPWGVPQRVDGNWERPSLGSVQQPVQKVVTA